MAVALCVLFLLTTVTIFWGFASQQWWFPAAISDLARQFDDQFVITLALTGFFFVLLHLVLAYVVVKFRGARAPSSWRGDVKWIWATVATMAVLDLGLAIGSEDLWSKLHLTASPDEALRVEVLGQQFAWNIRYSGPDGKFGRTDVKFVDDEMGNPFGVDPEDPDGRDDITSPTLFVPVGRPVEMILGSKDVLHSFFIRELRIKQDTVPGMHIPLRFTADTVGRYEVACAELCGLGHHQMRTFLEVLEPADYEQRLLEISEEF